MLCLALLCLAAAAATRLRGQIAVTDQSSAFHPVITSSGALMTDPFGDQQTGQGEADFIGFTAGTEVYVNGAKTASKAAENVAGFMVQSGEMAQGGDTEYLMFRFRFRDVNGPLSNPSSYAGTNAMVGVDLNRDGSVDFIVGADSTGSTPKLVFLKPGTGANTSPSTTDAAGYATSASTTLTSAGAGPVTFAYTASGTNYAAMSKSNVQNMNLTFAISYANLQQAIRDMGTVNGVDFSGFEVDEDTAVNFLAYTSTQTNAFNQDIYGGDIDGNSSATWTSLGAFSTTFDDGRFKPAPEFASVVSTAALVGAGLVLLVWRRRRRTSVVA